MSNLTMEESINWNTVYRKSHFAPAFLFLKKERRKALSVLYAVCRVLDDAVDLKQVEPEPFLTAWERVFTQRSSHFVQPFGQEKLAQDFLVVAQNLSLPMEAMCDLINKGVREDLRKSTFQTPMETEAYCYGVASTVGLACLPIFGVPVEEGKNYAIRLGIAVQWVNLIRDVKADAKMGRFYLPTQDLEQRGLTGETIFDSKNRDKFMDFMKYQANVARNHFKRAAELMPENRKKELLPARIMGEIYAQLLEKIERQGFPMSPKKVKLNLIQKIKAVYKEYRNKE